MERTSTGIGYLGWNVVQADALLDVENKASRAAIVAACERSRLNESLLTHTGQPTDLNGRYRPVDAVVVGCLVLLQLSGGLQGKEVRVSLVGVKDEDVIPTVLLLNSGLQRGLVHFVQTNAFVKFF